jgi:hypothetical protein
MFVDVRIGKRPVIDSSGNVRRRSLLAAYRTQEDTAE